MTFERLSHVRLLIPVAIVCGLLTAVGLAMSAGKGNLEWVIKVMLGLGTATYALFFLRHTWKVALFFCFAQFLHTGFGFTMTELEMTLALAALFFAFTWWRKTHMEKPPVLKHWSFGWFNTITLLWLGYLAAHTLYNIYLPYRPQEFALKNLLKTTEMWAGPLMLTLYFGVRPLGIYVRSNYPIIIARLLLVGLMINVGIRLFHFLVGTPDQGFDPNDPQANMDQYVTIPFVGLMENVYALRILAPQAMLFAGGFFTTRWFDEQRVGTRRLFYLVMGLSVIGAAISGGRSTLAATVGLLFVVLIMRGRIGVLMACLAGAIVLIAGANAMPDSVQKGPAMFRRSINWALVNRDYDASASISGSTDWRVNLFNKALDEWRSSPRIFWFGRATYAYGSADMMAIVLKGEEGKLESALRRGATHNLITDLLIAFGLFGLVLYFSLVLSFLFLLWSLYRSTASETARMFALILLVQMSYTFVVGLLGGTNFPPAVAWLYVVLIALLYYEHRMTLDKPAPSPVTPRPYPEIARPALTRRPSLPTRF